MRQRISWIVMGMLFAVPFYGSFAQTSEAIDLNLCWKPQMQHAGFLLAKELGYYDEVGLEVNLTTDIFRGMNDAKAPFNILGLLPEHSMIQMLTLRLLLL